MMARVIPITTTEAPARVLSPSQVNTFVDCQARWYYGSQLKLPDPQNSSTAIGSAVHHVARLCLIDPETTPAEAAEVGQRSAHVALAEAELRSDEDAAAIASQAGDMCRLFAAVIAPTIPRPALYETQLHGLIGGQHTRGIADILAADIVIDLKTSAKKPAAITASYALQLTTYAMLADKPQARLITIARTKQPTWIQHTLAITAAHRQYAETLYALAAEAMDAGLYLPNRGSHLCSRKHCAYWRECVDEYGGEVL